MTDDTICALSNTIAISSYLKTKQTTRQSKRCKKVKSGNFYSLLSVRPALCHPPISTHEARTEPSCSQFYVSVNNYLLRNHSAKARCSGGRGDGEGKDVVIKGESPRVHHWSHHWWTAQSSADCVHRWLVLTSKWVPGMVCAQAWGRAATGVGCAFHPVVLSAGSLPPRQSPSSFCF